MSHLLRARPTIARAAAAVFAAAAIIVTPLVWQTGVAYGAADDDAPKVRWSVIPADESGPDGRHSIEHEVDPGETVEEHFAVRNVGDAEVVFRLAAADGFYTRTGRFDILPADQESVDSGTWISLPETVTVPGGETVVVPFEITVPDLAEPGDHAAGITASVLSVNEAEDGTQVGVESRVGFRVLTRVAGDIVPAAALTALAGTYATSWNPLRPGEMTVTFDVVNEGNTRLHAEGSVSAGGRTVFFPAEGESPQELLPGDTRAMTVVLDDVWPLVALPTTITLTPTVLTMDEDAAITMEPVTADVLVWAPPWPQLLVLLGVALVVWAILWGRLRSRRRLAALIDDVRAEAREEGRKQAQTTAGAS